MGPVFDAGHLTRNYRANALFRNALPRKHPSLTKWPARFSDYRSPSTGPLNRESAPQGALVPTGP